MPLPATRVTAEAQEFKELERHFRRSALLRQALTHSSAGGAVNGQRLEFLGDAVVELSVRQNLLRRYPDASEGDLTRLKIDLVRGSTLARCADRLGLRGMIITGRDFAEPDIPDSMAADAYEAVVGALFLDRGFQVAGDFVERTLLALEGCSSCGDPKSRLQEYCQGRGMPRPEYVTEEVLGPSHSPLYHVKVLVNGEVLGRGNAPGRKNSEMAAAEQALKALEGED